MNSPHSTPSFISETLAKPSLNESRPVSPRTIKHGCNTPYGGKLTPCMAAQPELLIEESVKFPSLDLTPRQVCDLEMLMNGGFSPLTGFMVEEEYNSVVENMRLKNGMVWTIPITLDVTEQQAESFPIDSKVALRDVEGRMLAVIIVKSKYTPNKVIEAEKVFGSPDDICHPAIDYLFNTAGNVYIGGPVLGIQLPVHYDYSGIRNTPEETRAMMSKLGWGRVVGFQTRNPLHRSHRELTLRAARDAKAGILLHPVVGMTKPGDVDHYTRVRCYIEIMKYYPKDMATLSLLPIAMRMAGPKEAIWHAIIRRNYGCSHFIIGRDHAGPGNNKHGKPFYDPYGAQTLANQLEEEIGIKFLMYQQVVYIEDLDCYKTLDEVPKGSRVLDISGTDLRRRLVLGIDIPEWFSYSSVVSILRQTYPPRSKQGFTIWLTGLSGAGKSTIANALRIALLEEGSRTVSLLDGDEIRKYLSTELGFSKEHRDLNIKRIGYVASLCTKNHGVAICAAISPYREIREFCRKLVSPYGGFIEVHVSTPLQVCEKRDVKGLYAKARNGFIKGFTGIDDPYEEPSKPEMIIDTSQSNVREAVHEIMLYLESEGFLVGDPSPPHV